MGYTCQKYFSNIHILFLTFLLILIASTNGLTLKKSTQPIPVPVLNTSGISRSSSEGKIGLNLNSGSGQMENTHSASSMLSNLNNWANSANLGNTSAKLTGNGQTEGSTTGTNESIVGPGVAGGSSTHGGLLSTIMNAGTGEGAMRTMSGTSAGSGQNEGNETSGAGGNFQINGTGRGDIATRGEGNLSVNGNEGQSRNTISSAGLLNVSEGSGALATGAENAANLNIGNMRGSAGTNGSSSVIIEGSGTGYTETTGSNNVAILTFPTYGVPRPTPIPIAYVPTKPSEVGLSPGE